MEKNYTNKKNSKKKKKLKIKCNKNFYKKAMKTPLKWLLSDLQKCCSKRPAEYLIFDIIAKFNSFFNQGNLIDSSVCLTLCMPLISFYTLYPLKTSVCFQCV